MGNHPEIAKIIFDQTILKCKHFGIKTWNSKQFELALFSAKELENWEILLFLVKQKQVRKIMNRGKWEELKECLRKVNVLEMKRDVSNTSWKTVRDLKKYIRKQ